MQVRQVLVATLLAATAVGAMSQELDPGETLQARTLAAPALHLRTHQAPAAEAVVAATPAIEAASPVAVDNVAVADAKPNIAWAKLRATKPYAKSWLHGDHKNGAVVVAGRG